MPKKKAQTSLSPSGSVWLDETVEHPLITEKAKQLESFFAAMADGKIEADELQAQKDRLMRLMKEIEPLLSPELHDKVTTLLCELVAYDLMQMFYILQKARPKTTFQG